MKVAYLINQYPKISHTFVRREIAALEEAGVEVQRFTIRRSGDDLVDRADREELERTEGLLDVGPSGLAGALRRMAIRRPRELARALDLARRIGWRSERGLARHLAYLGEACVLAERLEGKGIRHVHAHFGTNAAAVAMLCHVLGGPPYSFTVHGPEEFDKPAFIRLAEKVRRARFVVAISEHGRSQLYRHVPHEQWKKIHVVRCGVSRDFLEAKRVPVPNTPRLVSVGRLTEQKGQLLLVEAVSRLVKSGRKDLELVLIGDGALRAPIEALVRREGIERNVRLLGWASSERVREEIRASRAVVLPSFAEGLPVVLMESLALGRPVVTTWITGIPELVSNGDCGWLVTPGSIGDLERALRDCLDADPSELKRLGEEGRRRVRERHDIHREVEKLAALFARYGASEDEPAVAA